VVFGQFVSLSVSLLLALSFLDLRVVFYCYLCLFVNCSLFSRYLSGCAGVRLL